MVRYATTAMSVEATNLFLLGLAYVLAGFCVLFMAYLGWRKLRRNRRRRRYLRPRSQQHRDTWG
jgi:hypothetical protein